MKRANFPHVPDQILVQVSIGESGVILAELPELDVFTEADSLNHLFLQVNDLIYTALDIPKEFQDKMRYVPPIQAQYDLIRLEEKKNTKQAEFNINAFYSKDFQSQLVSA